VHNETVGREPWRHDMCVTSVYNAGGFIGNQVGRWVISTVMPSVTWYIPRIFSSTGSLQCGKLRFVRLHSGTYSTRRRTNGPERCAR
jgi:hypothetical protein